MFANPLNRATCRRHASFFALETAENVTFASSLSGSCSRLLESEAQTYINAGTWILNDAAVDLERGPCEVFVMVGSQRWSFQRPWVVTKLMETT